MKIINKNVIASILLILIIVELVSRYFGLNQYPLFMEDREFEYIHKANQNTLIYRNTFLTNEFSMRSLPIAKNDTLVVLLIGDSVINGTNQVSHEDLCSTILEKTLTAHYKKNIRVLNISSYS